MIGVRRALSLTIVAVIAAAASFSGPSVNAQEKWPSRPITLVVPVGAGTVTDVAIAGGPLARGLRAAFRGREQARGRRHARSALRRASGAGRIYVPDGRQHHSFVDTVTVQDPSV